MFAVTKIIFYLEPFTIQ